jgi:hypothetical protein
MHSRWLFAGLLLVALAMIVWATNRTTVVYAGNLNLSANAYQRGDILVFSSNVNLPAGAQVDGSLLVLCCNVNLDGAVAGDLYLASGNLRLGPAAQVGGTVTTTAANVQMDPQAVVEDRRAGPGFWLSFVRAVVLAPALALAGLIALGWGLWRAHRGQQVTSN